MINPARVVRMRPREEQAATDPVRSAGRAQPACHGPGGAIPARNLHHARDSGRAPALMIDRMTMGSIPAKHHTALPIEGGGGAHAKTGPIAYEHCFTRKGFDAAYSILYHRHSPARESVTTASGRAWRTENPAPLHPLRRAHFDGNAAPVGGDWVQSRVPMLTNRDVHISVARPDTDDGVFFANGDGDEMLFFFRGGATLETPFGVQEIAELDYVWIPRACPYRLTFDGHEAPANGRYVLIMEAPDGFAVPKQFRNPSGQLTMDAPYTHRDFGRPRALVDPKHDAQQSTGPWTIVTKRDGVLTERHLDTHPCDIIGWDGAVYPVTFPILKYQPKTGKTHLPPTIHITFATKGAVLCSFVPRKVDYGDGAIPCPYPHSSVDCDEFLFYVRGHFTSRKGVGPGSISLHPSGLPHAPQPGAYERSIGTTETDELAVMVDTFAPLRPTSFALDLEDQGYMASWSPERFDEAAAKSGRNGDPEDAISQ